MSQGINNTMEMVKLGGTLSNELKSDEVFHMTILSD